MALTYSDKERMVLTATSLLLLESSLMPNSSLEQHTHSSSSSSSEASSSPFCSPSSSSSLNTTACSNIMDSDDFENTSTIIMDKEEGGGGIEWEADLLAGGYTNASYKVTARSKTTHAPLVCVFAKLAFRTILPTSSSSSSTSTSIANNERGDDAEHRDDNTHHDDHADKNNDSSTTCTTTTTTTTSNIMSDVWNHQRTDCEFIAMQYLHLHLPEMPIPRALACINVEENNSKLLITEWTLKRGAWADEFLQEPAAQSTSIPSSSQPAAHPSSSSSSPTAAVPVSPVSRRRGTIGGGYTSPSSTHYASSSSSSSSSRIINRARIASVAQAFARLNSLPFDTINQKNHGATSIQKDFNPSGRTYQASVMPVAREVFLVLLQHAAQQASSSSSSNASSLRPTDRVAHKVLSYGAVTCAAIAHNMEENYLHDRECLCHGDAHAFNILVKPPLVPDNSTKNTIVGANIGNVGAEEVSNDIVVIDWELCIVGPRGRDLGMLFGWPIACALWHAHQWRDLVALDILAAMDHLWTCYAQELMLQHQKHHGTSLTPDDLAAIYRNGLAWCGWFLFVSLYVFGVTMEHFTYEVDTEAEHEKVLESIGMVGLQLLHLGFVQETPDDAAGRGGRPYSLEELQSRFRSIVQLEIRLARPFPKPPPPHSSATRSKRQKRRFPSYLRSISVQSWSSSFSEDDKNFPPSAQSHHNATTNDQKISSSMSAIGGSAATGRVLGPSSLSASCGASCTSFLPRRSVSAVVLDHLHVPDKITPSDSALPFVIPIVNNMMPPPRSRSCDNSLHGGSSSSSSGEGGSQQHTSSFKFIYR
jgi:Choline/ethanolamine kinase